MPGSPHILRNDVCPLLACLAAVAAMPFVSVRARSTHSRTGWPIRRYTTPMLSVSTSSSAGSARTRRQVSGDGDASPVRPFPFVADLAAFVRLNQLVAARLGGLYGP